jgi:ATP-dependent Zn protease
LQKHREVLDRIAAALLEHEEISGEAVQGLLETEQVEA